MSIYLNIIYFDENTCVGRNSNSLLGNLKYQVSTLPVAEKATEAMAEQARVRCQRIGCDAMFSPDDNPDGSCQYHDSVSSFRSNST